LRARKKREKTEESIQKEEHEHESVERYFNDRNDDKKCRTKKKLMNEKWTSGGALEHEKMTR
jgi:hypothetical protein